MQEHREHSMGSLCSCIYITGKLRKNWLGWPTRPHDTALNADMRKWYIISDHLAKNQKKTTTKNKGKKPIQGHKWLAIQLPVFFNWSRAAVSKGTMSYTLEKSLTSPHPLGGMGQMDRSVTIGECFGARFHCCTLNKGQKEKIFQKRIIAWEETSYASYGSMYKYV